MLAEVVEYLVGGFEADAGLGQALLNLVGLDVHDAEASQLHLFPGRWRYLANLKPVIAMNNLVSADDDALIAQQLDNLSNMAERVASPEFKRSFRASVVERAKAAGSYLARIDKQGQLVREWPTTGATEVVAQ